IIYSGTVSAAREAAIMDVPAIAVSVTSHDANNYIYAGKVARQISKIVLKKGLQKGTLLNVNVPNLSEEEIQGILLTKQGKSKWDDIYEERHDPYGKKYFWLTGKLMEVDTSLEDDQFAVKSNYVSVTPIHFDLTDYDTFNSMKSWDLKNI
ncbi:MAG: 5'/3'-nucleotidase SurE, partial [Bacteroidota bacterium]